VLGRQGPECGPTPLRSWRMGCGLNQITEGGRVTLQAPGGAEKFYCLQ
jgi:hypothetical protein